MTRGLFVKFTLHEERFEIDETAELESGDARDLVVAEVEDFETLHHWSELLDRVLIGVIRHGGVLRSDLNEAGRDRQTTFVLLFCEKMRLEASPSPVC